MSTDPFKWSDNQIEKLIDLVKKNEAIFNTKHYNHRNRHTIDKIWSKIDIQLNKPPGVSREQWQKLRICYRRNYSPYGPKARWRFYDKLNFLSDFLRFMDPENSLGKCIKRAEQKYLTNSTAPNRVESFVNDSEEDKPEGQTKSNDNISIYYLSDEEITMENDEQNVSGVDVDEYHLVEYIQADNAATTSTNTHDSTKLPVKTIKRALKKRNYHDRIANEVSGTADNVSSSKDEEEMTDLIEEPDLKKIKTNSPDKDETIRTEPENMVTIKEDESSPNTSATSQTKLSLAQKQIEQQPAINTVTCLCQNDPDAIFLRSILEDVKSMSKKNKCSFKITVQKAILDILYADDD